MHREMFYQLHTETTTETTNYICCISYSNGFKTNFDHRSKHYEPKSDWEQSQSDLDPYYLQVYKQKREQTTMLWMMGNEFSLL